MEQLKPSIMSKVLKEHAKRELQKNLFLNSVDVLIEARMNRSP